MLSIKEASFFNGHSPLLAHLPFLGPKMVKFGTEFPLLCCRPQKMPVVNGNASFPARLSFWGPEWFHLTPNFGYCVVYQEKAIFKWKRVVSGPFTLLRAELVKFGSNFRYCAVDQETLVFQWKRAVSGPSALLGPKMVSFASNFLYCFVDQETDVFQWKRVVSCPSAFLGSKMVKFGTEFLLWYCSSKHVFNGNGSFLAHLICPSGAQNAHETSSRPLQDLERNLPTRLQDFS